MQELSDHLAFHPNRCFVNFLITGLIQGFLAGLNMFPSMSHVCKNLQSAMREPNVVDGLIKKEVDKGFLIGPYRNSPFPIFRINPIGVATRKYSGKKRLIIDLSAPHNNASIPSINSLIPLEMFSLCYASVDNAIQFIKTAGKGAWLGKADITDAFKTMPLHPSQWHLFGVRWRSKIYFAVRLTFGCRSSPKIFDSLSEALCWILLNNYKLPFVLHLLDDFLVVDFPTSPPARCISTLKKVFAHLGVPLSDEKTSGPCTSLEFLGIILDSVSMQASLPQEKLLRIREIIQSFQSVPSITKRDLLSLLGHLNFAMRIIPQGRSFISRLLDLSKSVQNLSDVVVLNEGCRSDLQFWCKLLHSWNGISFFYNDRVEPSNELSLFTDAAPSVGFAGLLGNEWFADIWPQEILSLPDSDKPSALFEIYPVVVACILWGDKWRSKRISVLCDNISAVNIINKGRSSVPFINRFIRRLSWTCVLKNVIITATYIPGLANDKADALSRFDFQKFRSLCPDADPCSLKCPPFKDMILD